MNFGQLSLSVTLVMSGWALFMAQGCGPGASSAGTATTYTAESEKCPEQMAQIQVGDAFLRILCGCKEPPTTTTLPGEVLTCTIPARSAVVFSFDGVTTQKQIISEGNLTFASSAIYTPWSSESIRTHGIFLETSGSYLYKDAFLGTLQGKIVVE